MPADQNTDATTEPLDLSPLSADRHASQFDDTSHLPIPASIYPLAPWRWILIITGLGLALFCLIPAVTPLPNGTHVFNGADLGVLLSLAIFAVAFIPGRNS